MISLHDDESLFVQQHTRPEWKSFKGSSAQSHGVLLSEVVLVWEWKTVGRVEEKCYVWVEEFSPERNIISGTFYDESFSCSLFSRSRNSSVRLSWWFNLARASRHQLSCAFALLFSSLVSLTVTPKIISQKKIIFHTEYFFQWWWKHSRRHFSWNKDFLSFAFDVSFSSPGLIVRW